MATHSSVLACRIPGTGEPSGLPSMGLLRIGHDLQQQQQQQQQAEMISSHTAFILTGRSCDAIPKQKTQQIFSTHKL